MTLPISPTRSRISAQIKIIFKLYIDLDLLSGVVIFIGIYLVSKYRTNNHPIPFPIVVYFLVNEECVCVCSCVCVCVSVSVCVCVSVSVCVCV